MKKKTRMCAHAHASVQISAKTWIVFPLTKQGKTKIHSGISIFSL